MGPPAEGPRGGAVRAVRATAAAVGPRAVRRAWGRIARTVRATAAAATAMGPGGGRGTIINWVGYTGILDKAPKY